MLGQLSFDDGHFDLLASPPPTARGTDSSSKQEGKEEEEEAETSTQEEQVCERLGGFECSGEGKGGS